MGPFETMLVESNSEFSDDIADECDIGPFEECITLAELGEALPMTGRDNKRLLDVITQMASENGVSPEANEDMTTLMDRTIFAFRKGRHTPEAWKLMGGFLTHVRKLGIKWDKSLLPQSTRLAMGLKEGDVSAETLEMDESFELGPKIMKAAKSAMLASKKSGLALSDAISHAARKFSASESGIWQAVHDLQRRGESLVEEEDEWSAVARDGVVMAVKGGEDVAFAALGSNGQPGLVSFLTNPDAEDKESARQVIDNWTKFQAPNQNGTVDAADGVDESFGSRITIYVDFIGGQWEAKYFHTDEQRDYRFTSHDRKAAILQAVRHSGYRVQDAKIVNVTNRRESLDEGFANFSIELFEPQPEFGTWEFKVLLRGEEVLTRLDKAREPADIIINDVDEHAGKINVYFVVEGRSESDAKRKLETFLKKALGTQKSMF